MTDWLLWCLEEDWRFVCVLGDDSRLGVQKLEPSVMQRYIRAGVRYWPTLVGEGNRFGPSVDNSGAPWGVWSNMKYVLANLDVPTEMVIAGSPGGPADLLKYVDERKLQG